MAAHFIREILTASTPWFVAAAIVSVVLWLASRCRHNQIFARPAEKFNSLTPFGKIVAILSFCLFTMAGGSKEDRGNGEYGENEELRMENGGGRGAILHFPFSILHFEAVPQEKTVAFEVACSNILFDYTASRNLYLFASTNLLDPRWMPLGAFAMPPDTNICVFAVTTNDVDSAALPWFLDSLAGIGFYRFAADIDTDGDGLIDSYETLCSFTDPELADTDDDGLDDGYEISAATDPLVSDTDGDGLSDGYEDSLGTDLLVSDTDGDGLLDGDEALTHGTDPFLSDTDGDGLPDYAEISAVHTDPVLADTDGDGLLDGDEILLYTDPLLADTDSDGMPDDSSWAELEESRVVLDNEELRIKVEVSPQLDSLSQCRQMFGDTLTIKTSGTRPTGVSLPIGGDSTFENLSGKSEIRITKTRQQLKVLGLLPSRNEDGVNEMAWVDVPETLGQDLSDSTAFSSLGCAFRGKAIVSSNPNLEATPPISQRSLSFLKAAGCEIVSVTYGSVDGAKRQIMNQADYFYFSGHGSHATGSLQGGLTPALVINSWNRDLDCVILAGCAVLDVRNYRFNSLGPLYRWKHKDWKGAYPGEIWEGVGVKYLLGYALKAPLDTDGGSSIASAFVSNLKSGKDIITSWRDANDTAKGRNACVIDCSEVPHQFWFWDESSGSPVWTKKEKGTVSW